MSTYFLGSVLEETQDSRTWNQRTGYTRIRHFKGTIDACVALAENTKAAKLAGDPTEIYFLEYTISQPSEQGYCQMDLIYQIDLLENWYLDGSDSLQSVWLKAEVVIFTNTLTDANLAYFHEAFDGGTEKHMSFLQMLVAYPLYTNLVYTPSTPTQVTMQKNLYNSLLKANTSFYHYSMVLRRENIVPNVTDILVLNLSIGLINKTFTPAQLLSTWPTLPPSYQSILPATGYWLYKTPSITQQTNNKLFVRQEWEFSEAVNTWLYKPAY